MNIAACTTLELGPLAALGGDRRITDIVVTCDGAVWFDAGRGMQLAHTAIPLDDPAVLRDLAVRLCAQLGVRLDETQPIADAAADDGTRVHAVIAPIVPQGASISIRFPDRARPDLESLAAAGMFPAQWTPMLRMLVRAKANMLVSGATGTGKTTLLKALLASCEPNERIVTVEEVRELAAVPHPHVVSLIARDANVEGAGQVGLPDLVKATLRMRPDRIVVGEVRGEEVVDLLRALNSGHRGSLSTIHADGVEHVPSRLIALGMLAGVAPDALERLADGAFDVLIHLERVGGRRRIAQIGMLDCRDGRLCGRRIVARDGSGATVTGPAWSDFLRRWCDAVGDAGGGGRVPRRVASRGC
ncbi:ATPase, T2SS/T4P/T4SS family [Bifidobacterium sp. AGR2158]|uniref:CpaF family protein n=1 Tax=Bifidobacterium sp. AGR2158 TaxID=1280675 RepID=UPI0004071B77|nr:ATPase, T2SS/T4P/T4SS family [Bifidobacterium sp. AGR2158]